MISGWLRFLDIVQIASMVFLCTLCLFLGWGMLHYREKLEDASQQLAALHAAIAAQNEQAQAQLAELTAERDARQDALDALYNEWETKSEQAKLEIDRLADELARRPVRVRVVTEPAECGPGGGSASGAAAAGADAGAADAAPAYGLLAEANSRRLARVIGEIETLNAAYAACRARLLPQ